MKIVFLDVDNVLNSSAWFRKQPTPRRFSVDPNCCNRVMKICDESKAIVVVSSSWRLRMKPRQLVNHLTAGGLRGDVIFGLTPRLLPHTLLGAMEEAPRGMEISEWLKKAKEKRMNLEKFVILDDKDDMYGLEDHLVQTSGEVGISDADVDAAILHLT